MRASALGCAWAFAVGSASTCVFGSVTAFSVGAFSRFFIYIISIELFNRLFHSSFLIVFFRPSLQGLYVWSYEGFCAVCVGFFDAWAFSVRGLFRLGLSNDSLIVEFQSNYLRIYFIWASSIMCFRSGSFGRAYEGFCVRVCEHFLVRVGNDVFGRGFQSVLYLYYFSRIIQSFILFELVNYILSVGLVRAFAFGSVKALPIGSVKRIVQSNYIIGYSESGFFRPSSFVRVCERCRDRSGEEGVCLKIGRAAVGRSGCLEGGGCVLAFGNWKKEGIFFSGEGNLPAAPSSSVCQADICLRNLLASALLWWAGATALLPHNGCSGNFECFRHKDTFNQPIDSRISRDCFQSIFSRPGRRVRVQHFACPHHCSNTALPKVVDRGSLCQIVHIKESGAEE